MQKYYLFLILLFATLLSSCSKKVEITELNLVPEPVYINMKDGSFTLSGKTKLFFENLGQNSETSKYVSKTLRKYHLHLSPSGKDNDNDIVFRLNDTTNIEIGDEGYIIEVKVNGIYISANTEAGLFYGFQTFMQMLPENIATTRYARIGLPCCTILDFPAFSWRGCHRDVSRHFFSVQDIKKQLDLMAYYKMNKFHWHLTDDHGWRIEIEKYPELNEMASWRVDRDTIPWGEAEPAQEGEERTYGGFYTKEEIKEVVEYAAERHIDVIPEIEFPGHCACILEAYPQFGCENDDTTYQIQIGPYWPPRAILCGGNDSVMQFLKDIMDEVVPLFPYEYVHVGGDEAYKDNWKRCPRCQKRIKELGLKDENQLQSWMVQEIEKYLALKGKKIIGWDEMLEGGISNQATIMSWQGFDGAVKAAEHGNSSIMTPTEFCYFDYYQANPDHQPTAMNHLITLYKTYQFNPIPEGANSSMANFILGGQCNLWSEFINDENYAEYMLLPRFLAMSECLWSSPDVKNWQKFRHKVARQKLRLAAMGYNYCEGSFKPELLTTSRGADETQVSFEYEVEGTEIRYTIDGSNPSETNGKLYSKPFIVKNGTTIKTACYYKGELKEEIYSYPIAQANTNTQQ